MKTKQKYKTTEAQRAACRRWAKKNPEKIKELYRRWVQAHPHRTLNKKWWKKYYALNRDIILKKKTEKNRLLKIEVLKYYAQDGIPQCNCCGEKCINFLTIDHVNNDGCEHRKHTGTGSAFYEWLKRHGFPQDPLLQILCYNCNYGKSHNNGICPHKVSDFLERYKK